MHRLAAAVEEIVATEGFSGAIRIDLGGELVHGCAAGMSHRGLGVSNGIDTQFALASGTKGLTALTVMSLVERGELGLDTTVRTLLGDDLTLIDDRVTVEQLLSHRSGIGDYLDEATIADSTDYVLAVGPHELVTTGDYLRILDGFPMMFQPGERFVYNNGAYVVLALIAERASGRPFHDLVDERVCRPAGLHHTAFLRADELPGRAALGYLHADGPRTNVFHLPVRGNGDGGIYSTAADVHTLWHDAMRGRVVSAELVAEMIRPRGEVPADEMQYGLGFWLHESRHAVELHGFDAGVGFRSVHHVDGEFTVTLLSNQTTGTWPVSERILDLVAPIG
jgi:CubicO group peptidase (beta-lactamase class C family)